MPLPAERFSNFREGQRKVNRDGHVEVAKAYYSAPPKYLGRTVWVRWDARLVRIFNHRFEQVALHVRHEPGRFSTLGDRGNKLGYATVTVRRQLQWGRGRMTAETST